MITERQIKDLQKYAKSLDCKVVRDECGNIDFYYRSHFIAGISFSKMSQPYTHITLYRDYVDFKNNDTSSITSLEQITWSYTRQYYSCKDSDYEEVANSLLDIIIDINKNTEKLIEIVNINTINKL